MENRKLPVAIATSEENIPDADLIQEAVLKHFIPGISPENDNDDSWYQMVPIIWVKENGYLPGMTNQMLTKLKESESDTVIFYNPGSNRNISTITATYARENPSHTVLYCEGETETQRPVLKSYENIKVLSSGIRDSLITELCVEIAEHDVRKHRQSVAIKDDDPRCSTPPD